MNWKYTDCNCFLDNIYIEASVACVAPFIANHKWQFQSIMKLSDTKLTALPLVSVPRGFIEWQERYYWALIKHEVIRTCEKYVLMKITKTYTLCLVWVLLWSKISGEYDHMYIVSMFSVAFSSTFEIARLPHWIQIFLYMRKYLPN